ncbi:protein obstructor-E [Parasteatoda tepidariorum]|uniref:protein obstructor-E n=1 Tax=Parasteatoda tepidariorum TaxID=114398 RepID=UPI00077FDBB4|nr:protein obstructor-E [Parasteatoda tepidariorum]
MNRMMNTLWIVGVFALIATVAAQKKDICKKDNGFYPHDDYCDYYYECVDGVPYLQECPNGLAFAGVRRGLINHCDYPHRVGCPDQETGKVMGQSPQGNGNCPWLFGIFAHEKSCTRYWLCWNGTGTVQMCPFSLLYNEVEHACDWPEKVPGCQQHPLCKGTPNGVKPIDGSCARYWHCMGGYPRLQRCPAGLAFTADAGRCEWANNVAGCEPTPAPEDDERSLQGVSSGNRRRVTPSEEDA